VFHGSRQARVVSTTHPNKPMHPTADTRVVINPRRSGRRVIGGVMAPLRVSAKSWAASAPERAAGVEIYL